MWIGREVRSNRLLTDGIPLWLRLPFASAFSRCSLYIYQNGKVCVVTGGARGLGNLMGRALVESGCDKLAILDLHQDDSSTAAQAMTEWIETEGAVKPGQIDIRGFACDVATESSVQKAFQDVRDVFGRIDTVINSAGIVENYPALEYPTDKLHKVGTSTN